VAANINLLAVELEVASEVLLCGGVEHLNLDLSCIREPSAEKDLTYIHPVFVLKLEIIHTVSVFGFWQTFQETSPILFLLSNFFNNLNRKRCTTCSLSIL